MTEKRKFTFETIGHIENGFKYHYEAPRQAVFAAAGAFLRWDSGEYAAAAEDLDGFDRIWLIWVFDQNKHSSWRTKVQVPVPAEKDLYSVFATRSPYRPNPIGISAVELVEITREGLQLGPCDLLNGTAVLDIKPYIPEVDAFPDAKAGWRDNIDKSQWQITWSEMAAVQADFILQNGQLDLKNFCFVQLSSRPFDSKRKRVEFDGNMQMYILHCRTWKIGFSAEKNSVICIHFIKSNYSDSDLAPDAADPYNDKNLHRKFNMLFS